MPTFRALLALSAALAAPATSLAAPTDLTPAVAVDRFQARVAVGGGSSLLAWDGPERFGVVPGGTNAPIDRIVRRDGTETSVAGGSGAVVRRGYAAAPDGYTALDLIDLSLDTFIARVRAGTLATAPGRVGGRATLRGTLRLGANDCAGLRGGTKTIDLDVRTLLPLRIVTRHAGSRTETTLLTGLRVGGTLPAAALRAPSPGGRIFRGDQGFRRVSPAAAGQHLPYVPELPSALPAGFARGVTGWAPRSGITGAEGSIPARPSLFAAVYARGVERIEVTQRRAVGGDWPGDPFGRECRPVSEAAVTVGGLPATYAIGADIGPHLYWRDGAVLHTVSGPFPASGLVAVAESLIPVAPWPARETRLPGGAGLS